MNGLKIIVLAKQVPDTRNVGKDAMKADGTIDRGALPAIFNPDDLKALEQALTIKDRIKGTTVTMLTMGPVRAAEIIREGLFVGADNGYLVTDKLFGGADTLATSYTISLAIKKIKSYDIIICGRQAIDGDTAQVGPQIAEKLKIPQITYAEEILSITDKIIKVKRRLEQGIEVVSSSMPVLITVHGSAVSCRPKNVKLIMKYKYARSANELKASSENIIKLNKDRPYLNIEEWGVEDIKADVKMIGLSGSPTKVKSVDKVVFTAKESRVLSNSDEDIDDLMKELLANSTIG